MKSQASTPAPTIALFGAPNTGKSTLFNLLTGMRQKVGNYQGVTVEKVIGALKLPSGLHADVIDLPGTYSLVARSEDEAVATRILVGGMKETPLPDAVIVVMDAGALERSLAFASQVMDFGLPTLGIVTMLDVADRRGVTPNLSGLSEKLGFTLVAANPSTGEGKKEILAAIDDLLKEGKASVSAALPEIYQRASQDLADLFTSISKSAGKDFVTPRAFAQRVLVDEGELSPLIAKRYGDSALPLVEQARKDFRAAYGSPALLEAKSRQEWAHKLTSQFIEVSAPRGDSTSAKLDRFLTHRLYGLVIFLLVMALVFQSIYAWADPFMGAIEDAFGWLGHLASGNMEEGPLRSLISAVIVDGVGGVMVFLPQIVLLFLFIAILEESGYMARAAFLMDRLLRPLGLTGRSFIPMLSGFACAVPAIMATRTIPDRASRMTTIMIVPLMSCSARLPVYTLMIGAFVPQEAFLPGFGLQGAVLLGMYLLGIVVAIPVALIFRKFVFRGKGTSFMLELPSYRFPRLKSLFRTVLERGRLFVVNAGTVIFAMAIIIWALSYFPRPDSILQKYETAHAALAMPEEEAQAAQDAILEANFSAEELEAEGFEPDIEGIAADKREEYTRLSELLEAHSNLNRHEGAELLEASILGRIGKTLEPVFEPIGWDWRISTATMASFPAREVVIGVMGTIFSMGDDVDEESEGLRVALQSAEWPDGRPLFTLATALSLMVFFALCMQCGASVAAIKRETNSWKWATVSFVYMTTLAYLLALVAFQVTTALL